MATKAEKEWMDSIVDFGCLPCLLFFNAPDTPAMCHHILNEANRRMGHMFTLPLCDGHHHVFQKNSGKIRRHPTKKQFVAAYGTELELLDIMQRIILGLK